MTLPTHVARVLGIKNQGEFNMCRALRMARVPHWEEQFRVGPYVLDFAWPAERIDLEVDGWVHTTKDVRRRDRERDRRLASWGFAVIRVNSSDDLDAVALSVYGRVVRATQEWATIIQEYVRRQRAELKHFLHEKGLDDYQPIFYRVKEVALPRPCERHKMQSELRHAPVLSERHPTLEEKIAHYDRQGRGEACPDTCLHVTCRVTGRSASEPSGYVADP